MHVSSVLRGTVLLLVVLLSWTGPPASAASPVDPPGESSPDDGWLAPVPEMTVTTAFDPPAQKWDAGHRGIDVAAADGEPVRAPAAGTVSFAGTVAGTPAVTVRVGGHLVSYTYVETEVEKGQAVAAGDTIGTATASSHCPETCIHVGVRAAAETETYLDPLDFFASSASVLLPRSARPAEAPPVPVSPDVPGGAPGAWGGHDNGRIPTPALCPLADAPGQFLRCDAAHAFDTMSAAFRSEFGRPISVTDAYRDYATQVDLKRRKGRMAATPGTSNHGWGLALDLGGGINAFGTPEHVWMRNHGARHGWVHPAWAQAGGSMPEPWHWEFGG